MKKFKCALINVVALLMVCQSSSSLNNNSFARDDFNDLHSIIELENFINDFARTNQSNLDVLSNSSFVFDNKDSKSFIRFQGDKAVVQIFHGNNLSYNKVFNLNLDSKVLFDFERKSTMENYFKAKFFNADGSISNFGKEHIIMKAFNLNQDMLDFVLAGPMAEGIEDNYIDVSAAMRTGINRFFSYVWVYHAIDRLALDCSLDQVTIYDIFRDPYQFSVYYSFDNKPPRYEKFLGVKDGEGYQGALDTLFYSIYNDNIPDSLIDKIVVHDYLEFQDKNDPIPGNYSSVQFVNGGNKHYRHQKDSDRISISDTCLSSFYQDLNGDVYTLSLN